VYKLKLKRHSKSGDISRVHDPHLLPQTLSKLKNTEMLSRFADTKVKTIPVFFTFENIK
jgi:hypothetical protein